MQRFENPFSLLIKDPVELSIVSIKAKLAILIVEKIRNEGWTQEVAARKIGCRQPRVSLIMNGRLSKFSIDGLFSILLKIGFTTDVNFDPQNMELRIETKVNKSLV
ncbi:helix-turn-helix domain-containing protein [Klebsiella pneumoniae]|uniref:helix-turn-helix domain-containing protein n=1 Tax=Klebsiella pneumoniae TaxID=573 RepID=UPI00203BF572|nr:XRE family transcriptional regulator [Klebsiella pneumoniae]USB65912.1 helix-turn-helix domain-containing protein [Klebsiella pneumoniae]